MPYSTNYHSTLITVAEDCPVREATPPDRTGSVARLQYELLRDAPFGLTSDELLLAVDKARFGDVDETAWAAKPRACLRASPLVKRHGFGLHHDKEGRVALVPLGSEIYARLLSDPAVRKRPGMRNKRV